VEGPAESAAGALMQLHQSWSARHGVRVLVISEGPMPVQDLKPIPQITSAGEKESALDWFSKAIEDANELVWNLDNESSVQDQICQDSERMAEELTQKDKRKLEVWKKELRVWKLRDCCETANRGDNPRFAFHENSDKRDGTRDLGSLPEQVPDGMCG